jgi:hypothetical protein
MAGAKESPVFTCVAHSAGMIIAKPGVVGLAIVRI